MFLLERSMSTTLIVVELLMIGCQVLAWVVLLLIRLCPQLIPSDQMEPENVKEWTPALATFAVVIAYTVGVVGDRFLGNVSTCVQLRLHKTSQDIAEREFYMTEVFRPYAHDYFETSNRQIRLLRATCFNSFITALVLLFGYWSFCKKAWLLPVLLVVLTLVSGGTWYMTYRTLHERHKEFYRACQKNQVGSTSTMESLGVD